MVLTAPTVCLYSLRYNLKIPESIVRGSMISTCTGVLDSAIVAQDVSHADLAYYLDQDNGGSE